MPDALTRKQFVSQDTKIDDEQRTITAVISTSEIDRDNEVLLPKGLEKEQYERNPVVLWAHDYWNVPIGRALWVKAGRSRITAKIEFAETEQAEEVYQLFKGGFLNAFSVGFRILADHAPTPDEIKKQPEWAEVRRVIDKWELLEFSAVPVPANPGALALAVKSNEVSLSDKNLEVLGLKDEPAVYKDASLDDDPEDTKTIDVSLDVQSAPMSVESIIEVRDAPISVSTCTNVGLLVRQAIEIKTGKVI